MRQTFTISEAVHDQDLAKETIPSSATILLLNVPAGTVIGVNKQVRSASSFLHDRDGGIDAYVVSQDINPWILSNSVMYCPALVLTCASVLEAHLQPQVQRSKDGTSRCSRHFLQYREQGRRLLAHAELVSVCQSW